MHFTFILFVLCFTCIDCANILCVFPFPAVSHQIVFQSIWKELSLRGHNVTVVTPNPLNDSSLTNLTEINVEHVYNIWTFKKTQKTLPKDGNAFENVILLFRLLDIVAEVALNTREFQNLIHDSNAKFDLIIVELVLDVMYALGNKFKAPVISVSSLTLATSISDMIGNPTHPVLYPDILAKYHGQKLLLWQKGMNLLHSLWCTIYNKYFFLPKVYTMARKYIDSNITYKNNLSKHVSGFFANVNPIIYPPRPCVPMLVDIGQMTHKPVKPLPKDLQHILDEAREGVVYFSLGTSFQTVDLEENIKKVIIEAFSELPYKVLWKWESDHLPQKPSNVEIRKWFPQQDILAHPNIRAFVTQGGLQSVEEAVSRAVPIVGLPLMADQPMNVQRIVDLGIGTSLDMGSFTKEELKQSIIDVCENNFYKQRIEKVRLLLFDKPMKELEKVIWWSEYFLRHKKVDHLKSPTVDVSWFHYLMVDVVLLFLVLVFCSICGGYIIVKHLFY